MESFKNADYDGNSCSPSCQQLIHLASRSLKILIWLQFAEYLCGEATPHLSASQMIFSAVVESLGFGFRFYASASSDLVEFANKEKKTTHTHNVTLQSVMQQLISASRCVTLRK